MSLVVTSPAFEHEKPIPSRYTCDGQDVSPPLEWTVDLVISRPSVWTCSVIVWVAAMVW